MLKRDQIISRTIAPTIETVPVPEFGEGGTIGIRSLTVREVRKLLDTNKDVADQNTELLIACCCDETGEPLFQAGDGEAIRSFPAALFGRLVAAANKLQGWGSETAAKN